MGDIAVDFVTQFHNLEGNLVGERKKNFYKLLENSKFLRSNEEQLNLILKHLQPKTYLESLFRIEVLIYFRKTSELLEILKEGNEVFISKMIKQPWFFKEVLKDINLDDLVNKFLPCLSYAIRMRVLKRLLIILNEAQVDELFDCVIKRYGLFIAKQFLHACSSKKINDILGAYEVILQPNQVKALFDKDMDLLVIYLDHHKAITGHVYDEGKVLKYIALKDPKILMQLEKKIGTCALGRRTSKRFVDSEKDNIVQDIRKYTTFLKKDIVVRKLKGEFKNIYYNLFPRRKQDVGMHNYCNNLLVMLPKKRRWELFAQTFSKVFDADILDNLDYLNESFFKLNPEIGIIRKWAEVKYNENNDITFAKYMEAKKSIPLIKEKINVTSSISDRTNTLTLLVTTCAQNKDLNSLEEVLKYYCFRHRNEDISGRNRFLDTISENFKLEDLNENHWKYINEQINILRVTKDFWYYRHSKFTKKYLVYLFENGKPFKDEIIQHIKDASEGNEDYRFNLKNSTTEKEILTQIIYFMPDVVQNSDGKHLTELTNNVIDFSKNNPENCICLSKFPYLLNYIQRLFNKTSDFIYEESNLIENVWLYNLQFPQYGVSVENVKILQIIWTVFQQENNRFSFENFLKQAVQTKDRSVLGNETLQFYLSKGLFEKSISLDIVTWLLKNEPQTVSLYFHRIVTNSLNNNYLNCKDLKLYSHLKYDQEVISFYKEQLQDTECDFKLKVIKGLCELLSTEDFIKVVEDNFLPQKEKLDLEDKEMKDIYKLQCEVVKTLNNVIEPVKMLPVVIKFCLGDYLQSALSSLYGIFYRSPEKQLYLYMDILSKRAVSVQKHAVFLSCELLDISHVVNMLSSTKRKNVSSQKHLFSATLKYFLKNQTDDLFNLLVSNMVTIDKNDTETLDSLREYTCIPMKYRAVYIEKLWKFFEELEKNGIKIDKYLCSLLLAILDQDVLKLLPLEFCKHIINNYYVIHDDHDVYNMENFVCGFLMHRESEQTENFNFVFDMLSVFKAEEHIVHIKIFFKKFYEIVSDEINFNFVKTFTQYWSRLFTAQEMFEEHVLLKLYNFMGESGEPLVENYAKNVVNYFEQLILEYNLHVYNKFKDLLKQALSVHLKNEDKYLFFLNILKYKITPTNCILILDLMPKVNMDNSSKQVFLIYEEILEIIKSVTEPIVVIYYKSYAQI